MGGRRHVVLWYRRPALLPAVIKAIFFTKTDDGTSLLSLINGGLCGGCVLTVPALLSWLLFPHLWPSFNTCNRPFLCSCATTVQSAPALPCVIPSPLLCQAISWHSTWLATSGHYTGLAICWYFTWLAISCEYTWPATSWHYTGLVGARQTFVTSLANRRMWRRGLP